MDAHVDINIVLDVLLDRQPFVADAKALWDLADAGQVTLAITATTVTTVSYLVAKQAGPAAAHQAVSVLLTRFAICTVDEKVLREAHARGFNDFEDAVQDAAAENAGIMDAAAAVQWIKSKQP
jgi:predicted nucleic acid-binding protein